MQRELSAKLTEGLCSCKRTIKQSFRHGKPCHLPLHKGGLKIVATSVAVGRLPQVADCSTSLKALRVECPKGGLCKPPARLVVMTWLFLYR